MIIEPPCVVMSPILAAGIPPIKTVVDPNRIESGGPTQVQRSPALAAGRPPIKTVTAPGGKTGPPTWGIIPVTMGQTCISDILAANGMINLFLPENLLFP
jgi:hypothetical protein